ncbi:MAG TPA: hypothetical protein VF178_11725 [Gemmatimonadaceae bacterium]
MAESTTVLEMVRSELERDPNVSTTELFEKAKKLDRTIKSLSLRQFHARYPLQVKRARAALRPRRRRLRKKAAVNRDAVRTVLLRFAHDVAEAEPAAVIDVIGNVDRYAEEIVKAAGLA